MRILEQCSSFSLVGQRPGRQRLEDRLFGLYEERYTLNIPNSFFLGFDADVAS